MVLIKCLVLTLLISLMFCYIQEEDEIEAEIEITLNNPQIGHRVLKLNGTQLMDLNKKLYEITKCVKETTTDSSVFIIVIFIENFLLVVGFFLIKYLNLSV